MNHDLHQGSRQFIGVYDGEIVAQTGIIQFPMRKGWKRVHRLVVLPDYQGIGIGIKFINLVSEIVAAEGFNINLTTTTPALVGGLKRSSKWSLVRKGVQKTNHSAKLDAKNLHNASSSKRPTFSFNFKK